MAGNFCSLTIPSLLPGTVKMSLKFMNFHFFLINLKLVLYNFLFKLVLKRFFHQILLLKKSQNYTSTIQQGLDLISPSITDMGILFKGRKCYGMQNTKVWPSN